MVRMSVTNAATATIRATSSPNFAITPRLWRRLISGSTVKRSFLDFACGSREPATIRTPPGSGPRIGG